MAIVYGTNIETNAVPSLDLRFADRKNLIDTISGRNLINFSRNSVGTYVDENGLIQSATSGEARFDHNPETGGSLGLLMEEARTNLLTYSEQFDNAAWGTGTTTVIANAVVAPDGTLTADELKPTATGFGARQGVNISGTYTATVFVKDNGAGSCKVAMGSTTIGYLINLNTVSGAYISGRSYGGGTLVGYSITSVGNGWFRVSVAADGNGVRGLFVNAADGTAPTSGIFVWGAQLEAGSFPTSYIPTTGSTVTRAADVASMTGTNFSSWYRQDEGTVFFNAKVFGTKQTYLFGLGKTGSGSPFARFLPESTKSRFDIFGPVAAGGSTTFWGFINNISPVNVPLKGVLCVKAGGYRSCLNGSLDSATQSAEAVPLFDQLNIGKDSGGSLVMSGTISRLTYWPTRLSDTQLQALTL